MTGWLDPVRRALDHGRPRWFFRDDDAGWDDARLASLIDAFRTAGVRVDLAAIPAAVAPRLGRRLGELIDEGSISVHQHGWAHADHETSGRRSEFGAGRPASAQARDIARGRRALAYLLGRQPAPIFTPPWNRCTRVTAGLLPPLGFTAISVDASAPPSGISGLTEIPVTLDWVRSFSRGGRAGLARELHRAAAAPGDAAIGVMLHHAAMGDDDLAALRDLLSLLRERAASELTCMERLADENSLTPVSPSGHGARAR